MFDREAKLNAFLIASDNNTGGFEHLPEQWECCLEILKPLKYLTYSLESDCSCDEVKVLVDNVMVIWSELSSHELRTIQPMFATIASEFLSLLKKNAYNEVITSYCLTELGREEIGSRRKVFRRNMKPTKKICSEPSERTVASILTIYYLLI